MNRRNLLKTLLALPFVKTFRSRPKRLGDDAIWQEIDKQYKTAGTESRAVFYFVETSSNSVCPSITWDGGGYRFYVCPCNCCHYWDDNEPDIYTFDDGEPIQSQSQINL